MTPDMQLAFAQAVTARIDELEKHLPIELPGLVLRKSPLLSYNFLEDAPGTDDVANQMDANAVLRIMLSEIVQIPLSHIKNAPKSRNLFMTSDGKDFDATTITLMNDAGQPYGFLVTKWDTDQIKGEIASTIKSNNDRLWNVASADIRRAMVLAL